MVDEGRDNLTAGLVGDDRGDLVGERAHERAPHLAHESLLILLGEDPLALGQLFAEDDEHEVAGDHGAGGGRAAADVAVEQLEHAPGDLGALSCG